MAKEMYRVKRMIEPIIRVYYSLSVFTEGRSLRDKLILFPVGILEVIGYGRNLMKVPIPPKIKIFAASRLSANATIKNRDGIFYCRKGRGDASIAAEGYEHPLRKYFEEVKSGVFVDIGANIGKYTVKVARQMADKGKVVAVEPDPGNFSALKTNIELNKLTNVYAFNVACWNKTQELSLYQSPSWNPGLSSVKEKVSNHFVKVKGVKLDDILKGLGIENVNLIKIDAEGAEEEVIQGARGIITKSRHLKVLFEAWDKEHFEKCKDVLEECGMAVNKNEIGADIFLAQKV